MMDMGGMVVGSFAPTATECYQEGLRIPPVRLFRRGEEVTEVFDVLRNNVRMSQLVEMDLRGLVAGCHLRQRAGRGRRAHGRRGPLRRAACGPSAT